MTLFAPPDSRIDMYDFYAERRQTQPVLYDPAQDAWAVYRHAEVKAVLSDYANFFSEFPRFRQEAGFRETHISVDPPRHRNLRAVVSKAFTPGAIARMAPRISEIATRLLDELDAEESFDLVSRFAHRLPVIVIAEMLGVPSADRPQYRRWADELLAGDSSSCSWTKPGGRAPARSSRRWTRTSERRSPDARNAPRTT